MDEEDLTMEVHIPMKQPRLDGVQVNTRLSLVNTDHVTLILSSHWSRYSPPAEGDVISDPHHHQGEMLIVFTNSYHTSSYTNIHTMKFISSSQ